MTIVLWWLSQGECQAIGDRLPKGMPVYIRDQYASRYGRPGRGRLWVDKFIENWHGGKVSVDPWPHTPMGKFLAEGHGGIAILTDDLPWIAQFPGIVTDLKLNRFTGEK